MWHQPCQRCKYTTSVDIQKCAIKTKTSRLCRTTCERNESARERRTALYKSDQHFLLSLVFVIKSLNPNVEAAFVFVFLFLNKQKVGLSFLSFSFPFLLLLLRVNTKTFGEISFSYASLSVWNTLPQTLRHSDSASSFKATLKTHLFNNYFRQKSCQQASMQGYILTNPRPLKTGNL